MFGYGKYKEGSREDYLMGVVWWHVATPEELEEWQKLQRPNFLKRWEDRLEYLKGDKIRKIQSLRENAISIRKNSVLGWTEKDLQRAHKFELQADFLETELNNGNYDCYYDFILKGY